MLQSFFLWTLIVTVVFLLQGCMNHTIVFLSGAQLVCFFFNFEAQFKLSENILYSLYLPPTPVRRPITGHVKIVFYGLTALNLRLDFEPTP